MAFIIPSNVVARLINSMETVPRCIYIYISIEINNNNNFIFSTLKPCPFTNCIQWRMVILDSTNLSQSLTIADCQEMFPRQLNHHSNIELFRFNHSSSNIHTTPTYGLRLDSDDHVTDILVNNNNQLISNKGINITITRGYLVSYPMDSMYY